MPIALFKTFLEGARQVEVHGAVGSASASLAGPSVARPGRRVASAASARRRRARGRATRAEAEVEEVPTEVLSRNLAATLREKLKPTLEDQLDGMDSPISPPGVITKSLEETLEALDTIGLTVTNLAGEPAQGSVHAGGAADVGAEGRGGCTRCDVGSLDLRARDAVENHHLVRSESAARAHV